MLAGNPDLMAKIHKIVTSRNKFYDWVNNVQKKADHGKETRMVEMQEYEDYISNATDFMEVLCKEAQGPLALNYHTAISPNVQNFQVDDNPEVVATVEIMWARLAMVFGSLQNCNHSLGNLSAHLNVNMEAYSDSLKHCLSFVSYAGTRMGKLNYLKKYLVGIFGTGNHKYAAVCEMNYHILEAIMLMIEVSYASLFLLKIFTLHDNSQQYLKLVPSFVHYGRQKNKMLREILSTLKTTMQDDVINFFYLANQEFFEMCPHLAVWCENWYIKCYQPERDRSQEQLDYDLMVIGQQVMQKMDVATNYFGTLCRAKHRNTMLYHVMNISDKNHTFKTFVRKNSYNEFELKDDVKEESKDNIRLHFAAETKLKREEISDCCN